MILEGGSWTGVFLNGNATRKKKKKEDEEEKDEGKKIQGRDAVWNPNGHFPAYRAESVGQRKGWGSQYTPVLYPRTPAALTIQGDNLPGPWTGKDKGTHKAIARSRVGGSEEILKGEGPKLQWPVRGRARPVCLQAHSSG